jgi:hypothetical protein
MSAKLNECPICGELFPASLGECPWCDEYSPRGSKYKDDDE